MEKRTCLECEAKLSGRKDQKFCADYCRNTYNNRQNEDANATVRRINGILRKNRRILAQHNPNGKKKVGRPKKVEGELSQLSFLSQNEENEHSSIIKSSVLNKV